MNTSIQQARFNMVEQQVRPWDVVDARVLAALSSVPREQFVPAAHRELAFADLALPLTHGEVMMRPVHEGRMLQGMQIGAGDSVLEVGTGSGFITACLAFLAADVLSVEFHADLAEQARAKLLSAGVGNARVQVGDALSGFDPRQQFDAIALTGAVASEPMQFRGWLKPGGRLFLIRGQSPLQEALCIVRRDGGRFEETSLFETDLPYLINAAPPKRFVL
ncbi:MAG: protein-L-isoaspartate O-methyltransferase [Lysobacterales bacterium]